MKPDIFAVNARNVENTRTDGNKNSKRKKSRPPEVIYLKIESTYHLLFHIFFYILVVFAMVTAILYRLYN